MSMLSAQSDELRKMAAAMSERGSAIGLDYGMGWGLVDAARMMREAADTIESLRDRLCESYGQVPELGKRDDGGKRESCESNYTRLFGTPERAARTLAGIKCDRGLCDGCTLIEADCSLDSAVMLEWLRGESDGE